MINLFVGFGSGLVVTLVVSVILNRKYKKILNAILDLDWDMDGKSNELYEKIKDLLGR